MVVAVHGVEVRLAEGLWLASGVMCRGSQELWLSCC